VADCPGLVFPSLLPKPLQILAGVYNIAQVNEPYSVVQYLAERVPLPEMLDLVHPSLVQDWQGDAPRGPMKVCPPPLGASRGGTKADDYVAVSSAARTLGPQSNAELRKLPHPPWTAWEICEGTGWPMIRVAAGAAGCGRLTVAVAVASPKPWLAAFAIKKGFYTARAGRPDAYRAGTAGDARAVRLRAASLT